MEIVRTTAYATALKRLKKLFSTLIEELTHD